ncbi:GAF domain-containing sensor histidine kinase [Dyadobacter sediminis]|uniref:histidine kinase n=1 Tax=Dyadobacter sediminis TaxID=1493691 RepID=A0A5R9KC72_9BACT|nr:ATP-binding protein [Dyadobacter sediminis]TLU92358.1 GAF domain-containing protein [Dyadobacter sediminis]GGB95088.1 sensor histidine kinase [Dyadobacter sediminis]
MVAANVDFINDIERIRQITIVPKMLEVICSSTGMGFAAIARVTEKKWVACSVRDEISFGLEAGGELILSTTICNEIRDSQELVVIEDVSNDEIFCNHPTPKLYGFQSYISVPIMLKNGAFFGTLCAIDPKPARINNTKTIEMFNMFAELISFHLQSLQLLEDSASAVQNLNRQLTDSIDENRQYKYISNHNLQEPLRKIRLFSSMLVSESSKQNDKIVDLALRLDSSAQRFSMMIKDLSDYSALSNPGDFESVDLDKIIADVCAQLSPEITCRNAVIHSNGLPVINAIPLQMEQLFYHLISNALKFSKEHVAPVIEITSKELKKYQEHEFNLLENTILQHEICIKDNGVGIENSQLKKIFDIFSQMQNHKLSSGEGIGLAYCKKIVRNHAGMIQAHSEINKGTTFLITLPVIGRTL